MVGPVAGGTRAACRYHQPVLYLSIWAALVLLAVAELGKGPLAASGRPASWAKPVWVASVILALVHTLLAFQERYAWDHETAVRETARVGAAVYGFEWRGSLYVNYVFVALWATVAWPWRHWAWRAFVLLMVVNGAVIFARPGARPFGALVVAALVWIWWGRRLVPPVVQRA
jgi:hypothetical protein